MTPLPPEYEPRTAAALLSRRASEEPNRVAFVAQFAGEPGPRHVTRREWEAASASLAAGLWERFDLAPGAKVAWVLDNRCGGDALVLYQAVHRLGAVNVPISTRSVRPELEHVLTHSGSTVCVFDERVAEHALPAIRDTVGLDRAVVVGSGVGATARAVTTLEEISSAGSNRAEPSVATHEDDEAALLYTSGTTGRPKGVVLSQANVVAAGIAWADAFELVPDDVFHTPFPIYSGAGLHYTAMAALFAGATCVVDDYETDRTLATIEREGTTVFAAVPSILQFMLESPMAASVDTRALRILAYGGASMPAAVIRRLRAAFPTAGLVQTYGLTEAGPGGTYLPAQYAERFLGSIGTRPAGRFTSVRVIDDAGDDVAPGVPGELVLRGASVMRGYHGDPEATHLAMPDGWLRTGDIVRFDEHGAIYHLDRKKDIIIRGGFNVASVEVESALLEHRSVLDAAAVGKPHDRLGEVVIALVVLRSGEEATEEELVEHCRSRLADYKVPSRVLIRDELPRSAAGKILKQILRDELRDGWGRDPS